MNRIYHYLERIKKEADTNGIPKQRYSLYFNPIYFKENNIQDSCIKDLTRNDVYKWKHYTIYVNELINEDEIMAINQYTQKRIILKIIDGENTNGSNK